MTQSSGIVTLQNGDWTDAFQRLNELGGVSSAFHRAPTTVNRLKST